MISSFKGSDGRKRKWLSDTPPTVVLFGWSRRESASYSQTRALNWSSGINEQGLAGSTWHPFTQIKACLSMHRQGSRKLCDGSVSLCVCPCTGTYPKKLVQWSRKQTHLTRITKDQWSKLNHIRLRVFEFLRGPYQNKQQKSELVSQNNYQRLVLNFWTWRVNICLFEFANKKKAFKRGQMKKKKTATHWMTEHLKMRNVQTKCSDQKSTRISGRNEFRGFGRRLQKGRKIPKSSNENKRKIWTPIPLHYTWCWETRKMSPSAVRVEVVGGDATSSLRNHRDWLMCLLSGQRFSRIHLNRGINRGLHSNPQLSSFQKLVPNAHWVCKDLWSHPFIDQPPAIKLF